MYVAYCGVHPGPYKPIELSENIETSEEERKAAR
jgi:hypothetical protein